VALTKKDTGVFERSLFSGQRVVVIGAARGIGKVIGETFLDHGADVVGVDVFSSKTATNSRFPILKRDVSDLAVSTDLIEEILGTYGDITILINNARAKDGAAPLHDTLENFTSNVDVGLLAPLLISQSFIKHIISKPSHAVSGGVIINISSIAASTISRESASYHIIKAGLESLTRYLAVYAGESGVRVNAIAPGFIVQDEHKERFMSASNSSYKEMAESVHPLNTVGNSQDVANVSLFLASNASRFITGETICVSGGLNLQDNWDMCLQRAETVARGD
jgi:NAD(P)-dependent dehydrogenase (short-subunit alcohol dehydrogenase family)